MRGSHSDGAAVRKTIGVQPHAADDDCVGARDRDEGGFVVGADLAHPRHRPGIVGAHPQFDLELNVALDPANAAHDIGVLVVRHELDHLGHAGRSRPACVQDEAVALVRARGGCLGVGGAEPPSAVAFIAKQRAEERGGIEAGQTQPVDTALARNECRGAAVTEHCVVLDGSCHALILPAVAAAQEDGPGNAARSLGHDC